MAPDLLLCSPDIIQPAGERAMKRVIVPILLLLAAGGFAGWWFLIRPKAAEKGLVLAGSIEARTVEVGSLVGGRVAAVHVEEGARVAAGQPIVTFETDLRDLEIAEQRAQIAEARANLAKVKAGPRAEELRRARIDWESAEVDRKRFEDLSAREPKIDAICASNDFANRPSMSWLQSSTNTKPPLRT